MEINRRPFQGVGNILRFNWHFYVIAGLVIAVSLLLLNLLPPFIQTVIIIGIILSITTIIVSLAVSFYIYDLSGFYKLNFLKDLKNKKVINIHAGFDETSEIIRQKFNTADLTACDFYNPEKHTEISIKRARKAYPPDKDTITAETNLLPFSDDEFDVSIVIFSAHEIRDEQGRIQFFRELSRVTQPSGQIFVTEHLRDFNNFIAYSVGFMHFHSKKTWLKTFEEADIKITTEIKSTPFVTTFILEKNGNTL